MRASTVRLEDSAATFGILVQLRNQIPRRYVVKLLYSMQSLIIGIISMMFSSPMSSFIATLICKASSSSSQIHCLDQ